MRSLRRWLAVGAALALAVSACGGDDDDGESIDGENTGSEGGGAELVIAIGSEPTSLDPQAVDDGGERAINDNIYETLMARTPDGELVPGLAAQEPTQVDDTTWQFVLRDGLTFSNGEALDGAAVAASVNRIVEMGDESEQAGYFATITGAEAVDATTVNITTNGPDPVLPARMYWMKIVPPEASQAADFAENPAGSGPYLFESWERGSRITLTANPDYWGDPPAYSKVTFNFIEEPGTRLSGLLSGEYDLITNLQPEDVERAPKSASVLGSEHPVLILDADEGVTADVRVRQAVNYAVDKDALAEALFGGHAEIDKGQILSPTFFGFNPDLEPYDYDPDRARELLAEAGAEGATIQLVGTSGRWLKDRETVEAVAGYLEEVGLNPDVQIYEFGEYLDRLFDRESRADAIYVTSSNELLDADRQLTTYYQAGGIGSSNSNEELSALIDEARTETDEDARTNLYNDAVKIAYDEAYFLFLLNIEDTYGMSEDLDWSPRTDAKLLVKEMKPA